MRVDRIIREIHVIRGLNKLKVDSLELKVSFKIKVDSKICVFLRDNKNVADYKS